MVIYIYIFFLIKEKIKTKLREIDIPEKFHFLNKQLMKNAKGSGCFVGESVSDHNILLDLVSVYYL